MVDSFAHLHVHTEFSMLDGASRVGELAQAAAADGQPALAMTDHGNMYGVLDFYRSCKDHGVKPIIGIEAYMAHDHRSERPKRRGRLDDSGGETQGGAKLYYHLILLAENQIGYKNLIQLSSRSFLEGYYYKPRVDWELLERYSEGVIATTGCLGGHVLQDLMRGDTDLARAKAGKLQDIFGRDSLFIELQDHGIPAQRETNPQLLEIAKYIGAPLLATNDCHYTHQHQHDAHDALLCVQTGSLMSDPDRFKFEGTDHYLKSSAEMRHLFRDVPQACDNTLWIAERCELEIEFGDPKLPTFPLPEGFATDTEYLKHLTFEGARKRWGDNLSAAVVDRLNFELKVIDDMGFSAYFLITGDLIDHARAKGIRVGPGRGSAAGCAVAYTLWITDLDPIKYDLLFERFLNPGRKSMPDIDMDFDSRYRDEMIRYCAERYGREHVAQIVTFSTIKARAAVRDAARVLGHPYAVGDRIAKLMPPLVMGRDTPLYACFEEQPKYADGYGMAKELRQLYQADPEAKEVIDVARGLEGLRRSDGIHAAAVVITDEPLTEYLPIQRKPESGQNPDDAPVVTQYEMGPVEDLGLLKMDFLGLRNLDVISDTLEMIEKTQGVTVDIDNVDLEDLATYELLQRGDTIGVFQLESSPMRALMRSLAPTTFDDVAALVALYRPGPMAMNMHNDYADRKNGRQAIEVLHPDAAEILSGTYGLMIYQESMMRIAQKFAGYSLEEADNLRKACGKKIREVMAKEKAGFVSGCENTGYGTEVGEKWWEVIEPFADYAFNKSHSYGYGFVAFQIAYLKAHYPVEYLACLLTSVKTNLDKASGYLHECRMMDIPVEVPDVNQAEMNFSAGVNPQTGQPDRIIFGLSAVRGVGEGLVTLLVQERNENGPFIDFYDFCERVDPSVLNKRTIEALIKAGGFDAMGYGRKGLLQVFETIIDLTLARRRERDMGIQTLFGDSPEETGFEERPSVPDLWFEKSPRLAFEKEMLGLYVSDHPLMGIENALRRKSDCSVADLKELPDGEFRCVGGVVTNLQRKFTRKQDLMAVMELEDLEGSIEVMVFPKAMMKFGHALRDDAVVLVKGRVKANDDERQMIANEVEIFEAPERQSAIKVKLNAKALEQRRLEQLKEVLLRHPGDSDVLLELGPSTVVDLGGRFSVRPAPALMGELTMLLGPEAVTL
ncbi:MAG: DNA polymerase III subunit alpha [Actinomycetota bacterium]